MKFRNQARLCLAVSDFETHIMLSLCLTFQGTGLPVSGAAPRGRLEETVPPTPHKGHFCKLSRTDEKKLGYGGEVTSPTIFEFQPKFVTRGFQRPDLTYILSNIFFITDVLNLFQ